jgi:hypothetical protein
MPGKKTTENTKKAAGNAKKAEVAAQKAAVESAKKAAVEDEEWSKGAKSTAKKWVSPYLHNESLGTHLFVANILPSQRSRGS